MAQVTKPIALDESFNTTESTPRNTADVLAEGLDAIKTAIENGGGGGGGASTVSQLTDVLLSSTVPNGDVLVRDNNLTGGKLWKNKSITVEMTQAEYNAIVDFTPYANTHIVITDAPNLNATASDIEYSSGVSVADMLAPTDVSSDISRNTTNVSQFTANCYTVGKVAIFDALDITTSVSMGADEVMLTGLPAPATNQTFELSGYSDMKSYRVRLNTSGELRAWHNSSAIPNNISLFGGFSYVIA